MKIPYLIIMALLCCLPVSSAIAGTCLDGGCHQRITEYKFLHGPTAAEQAGVKACIMCHSPKGAECSKDKGGDFELKTEGICLTCHEKGTGTQHSVETPNCLSCHDPHGSNENQNFLKKNSPGK